MTWNVLVNDSVNLRSRIWSRVGTLKTNLICNNPSWRLTVAYSALNRWGVSSNLTLWTIHGIVVKWLSQQTFNLPILGSSPSGPTIDKHIQTKRIGSLDTALDSRVAGSIPVSAWSAPSVFFYGDSLVGESSGENVLWAQVQILFTISL